MLPRSLISALAKNLAVQRRRRGEVVTEALPDHRSPTLTAAFYGRFRSRGEALFEDQLLSAMRHGFEELVNDACGHAAGGELLRQAARSMTDAMRSADTLARTGGDEFAAILESCSSEQAQRVAQAICDRLDDFRFVRDGRRFRIGASIGLAPIDERWSYAAVVLQAADVSYDVHRGRIAVIADIDPSEPKDHSACSDRR